MAGLKNYVVFIGIAVCSFLVSCGSKKDSEKQAAIKKLPVLTLQRSDANIDTDYPARIEGKVMVDIRSQADGYIEKIFVDEGAYVKAGQPLFKINDHALKEQLNTAKASFNAAKATLKNATLELKKNKELSTSNVVSDYQLKAAQANFEHAKAQVAQNASLVEVAKVNLAFAIIKAPVSGYIGSIPKRIGNLVSKGDALPLTTLSDVSEVYAYFSMTEKDYLRFISRSEAKSFQDKVSAMPKVKLMLADGNAFANQGRIQMIDGQFDKATGAISVRAIFSNKENILRSGNTGRVVLPENYKDVILVPVLATLDVQNKIFVYRLSQDNKAERVAVTVNGKSGDNYLVSGGLHAGDRIVTKDLTLIQEGEQITPEK
ncbi:efflux RND transporter periplasmic adaptor subunit [Pedobacter sp. MR22-3]|uniref:efflux RND transporter periplasmic adaptor subunit n=1 Tax=Pedobacter sp. MR22-3 TaxID=2994552 RepID=UPI00224726FD|nr:efflux RND transporter periplasmic adaptor subunit [Pedobacter sp. MR22-3]MCX2585618.1 efflux RND transporter periplasmic adaptor subunit [Pedobacter sp. MR22-3]